MPHSSKRVRSSEALDQQRIAALLAPFIARPLLPEQLQAIEGYLRTLLRWNERMNLTAVRDPERVVRRHFGESLFAAEHLFPEVPAPGQRVIDVGSGAGFPGLPIRIYAPVELTLIESQQKKAVFLREIARQLGLPNIEVFAGRAKDYAPKGPGPVTVTMRAVERFALVLAAAAQLLTATSSSSGAEGQRRLALLIGSGQVGEAKQLQPELAWSDPVPIPQSDSRVLLVGQQFTGTC